MTAAPPPQPADRVGPGRVVWSRVGLFCAITFGGAWLVAGLVTLLEPVLPAAARTAAIAALYMPLPLVAGLVVERVAGRRRLLAREAGGLRTGRWRLVGRIVLVATLAYLVLLCGLFAAGAAGAALGLPGAGQLLTSTEAVRANLGELLPGVDLSQASLPSPGVLIAVSMVQALIAGLTINGLFAFGEEYGWRGVLTEELEPLGTFRATALIGVVWGLWHAPLIILLGHNYGAEWRWGVWAMVAWTVPFSFLLRWTRLRSASVLAPAVVHGAVNGIAGIFAMLLAGGSPLIMPPAGVLGAVGTTGAAAVLWLVWRRRLAWTVGTPHRTDPHEPAGPSTRPPD